MNKKYQKPEIVSVAIQQQSHLLGDSGSTLRTLKTNLGDDDKLSLEGLDEEYSGDIR